MLTKGVTHKEKHGKQFFIRCINIAMEYKDTTAFVALLSQYIYKFKYLDKILKSLKVDEEEFYNALLDREFTFSQLNILLGLIDLEMVKGKNEL